MPTPSYRVAMWAGGWIGDFDWLRIEACRGRVPDPKRCVTLSAPAEGFPRPPVVSRRYLGWYLFAFDQHWARDTAFAGVAYGSLTALGAWATTPLSVPSAPVGPIVAAGHAAHYVRVPATDGLDLATAYRRLHARGLRVTYPRRFDDGSMQCPPRVAHETPRAGTRVARGTIVRLAGLPPGCAVMSPAVPTGQLPQFTVPAFIGQRLRQAVGWAERHDLYWQALSLPPLIAGDAPTLLGNYLVTAQRPAAGSLLSLGIEGTDSFDPTPLILSARLR